MKRSDCVTKIARKLATIDGYAWQAHPDWRQMNKHEKYKRTAETLIAEVERGLIDFKWSPEED